MRTPLIILLTLISLVSQWAWLEHAYHEHDPDEACEICLIGQAQAHAATSPAPKLPAAPADQFAQPLLTLRIIERTPGRQTIRAPHFLSNTHC
jgi:hypothetical protein